MKLKKFISTFTIASILALMPEMMTPVLAAPEPAPVSSVAEFKPCPRGTYRVKKRTRRGRRIVNSLIAGGVGAAVGGAVGGGKGALLGLGAGTGGYLVYRYVKTRKGTCVRRYVRG
jgi:hypothetical protein